MLDVTSPVVITTTDEWLSAVADEEYREWLEAKLRSEQLIGSAASGCGSDFDKFIADEGCNLTAGSLFGRGGKKAE